MQIQGWQKTRVFLINPAHWVLSFLADLINFWDSRIDYKIHASINWLLKRTQNTVTFTGYPYLKVSKGK